MQTLNWVENNFYVCIDIDISTYDNSLLSTDNDSLSTTNSDS